jgi:hypothetical protein
MNSRKTFPTLLLASAALLAASRSRAADFYAAPNGSRTGTGSQSSPWDLQTALSQPSAVHPGDTIWLRGGRYVGTYRSSLTGTAAAPIKVRQFPGERATVDGNAGTTLAAAMDATTTTCTLAANLYGPNTVLRIDSEDVYLWGPTLSPQRGWNGTTPAPHAAGAAVSTNTVALAIDGAYTWYMGFEIMNSSGARSNATTGSLPPDRLGYAIDDNGPGTKVINMVLHDAGQGLGLWTPATDAEAYGNVISYNGWDASDRGHGHGIYTQNQAPSVRRVVDNILFDQFAIGVQAYTGGGSIDNIQLEGNVAFGNGALSKTSGYTYNLLVGGMVVAASPSLVSNFTYTPPAAGGNVDLGYNAGCTNAAVSNNYFTGANSLAVVACATGLSISGNTFYGGTSGFTPSTFPSNTYLSARPTANRVFVRPNQYEAGRANVVVYNWQLLSSVSVDLSGVLQAGAAFEVRNAQDFFAAPVLSGTYAGGAVSIPMGPHSVAAPVGAPAPPAIGPEFGVFVVLTVAPPPACTYALGATSASVGAAGGSGSVAVTAGSGCAWTASSGASWLTITGGTSGAGNGTASWSAAANSGCSGRSASLTIAGKTYTVTQAAGTGAASISPTAATTSSGSGGGTISVTIGAGCAWTAASNAPWLTITAGKSGTGNSTVNYTIASNSACSRTGTLTVAGKTFTVSQSAGGSCSPGFFPVSPCRVLDTRLAPAPLGGPSLAAEGKRVFPVTASSCRIPPTAKSVSVNVTAVLPAANGSLHAYPGNVTPTSATILSFRKGRTRAATAVLSLATDGSGTLGFWNESTGSLDILLDVSGYFE